MVDLLHFLIGESPSVVIQEFRLMAYPIQGAKSQCFKEARLRLFGTVVADDPLSSDVGFKILQDGTKGLQSVHLVREWDRLKEFSTGHGAFHDLRRPPVEGIQSE
jgi:hypothetical protein